MERTAVAAGADDVEEEEEEREEYVDVAKLYDDCKKGDQVHILVATEWITTAYVSFAPDPSALSCKRLGGEAKLTLEEVTEQMVELGRRWKRRETWNPWQGLSHSLNELCWLQLEDESLLDVKQRLLRHLFVRGAIDLAPVIIASAKPLSSDLLLAAPDDAVMGNVGMEKHTFGASADV